MAQLVKLHEANPTCGYQLMSPHGTISKRYVPHGMKATARTRNHQHQKETHNLLQHLVAAGESAMEAHTRCLVGLWVENADSSRKAPSPNVNEDIVTKTYGLKHVSKFEVVVLDRVVFPSQFRL